MKKTIKTEYLEERINRLIVEYENYIKRDTAELSIIKNPNGDTVKTLKNQIEGARLMILGMEKIENIIMEITK